MSSNSFENLQRAPKPWRRDMEDATEASTLHDIRRGRRTGIEPINRLISRKATEHGVRAPLNGALTREVLRMERDSRSVNHLTKGRLFRLLEVDALEEGTR